MIITTRFTTGTFIARAKGKNVTASCAESSLRAAERVAEKLGLNPDLLEPVVISADGSTYSLQEDSEI